MAWMQVIGNCWGCDILFTFNANHVPSMVVDGIREPLCRDCMTRLNAKLVDIGRDPVWIHPDAYEPEEMP
jgi:hypothetical protein